ncbi:esterase-like activity of phytase family protein [Chelatococcus sp. SYSU_G07232]|uniref:Esterase-like activity of phytase family protein n=1 Tax=Chelatococcus albus TaxID=3047466 RepID=A0ABT7ADE5_9HYPH|nr:esterase-like activity of phytase family protein [Chelatococcus sp. SYSU_G07232]MDJ1157400.1 esterase-like activity of phytase family protein [Chelatococcus sp. SYSU_G07232]
MTAERRGISCRGFAKAGFAALVLALASPTSAAPPPVPDGPVPIIVTASPITHFDVRDPARTRFGALEFRGGLALRSSFGGFGGLSGAWRAANGAQLVAVTDRGWWLTARPVYVGGRLAGLAAAEMAPMRSATGRALERTRSYDTESLAIAGGVAFVGVERTHEVLRFDWAGQGPRASAQHLALPADVRRLPPNRGLEAIGVAPPGSPVAGALVAVAEQSGETATAGFVLTGAQRGTFSVTRRDGFAVTDLAFLPNGDLVLLERRFVPPFSIAMRLRRIDGGAVRPGAVLDGAVLMQADGGYEIDNMEGLAVHRNAAGETILTLLSDDNFSPLERTLMLEFALVGE